MLRHWLKAFRPSQAGPKEATLALSILRSFSISFGLLQVLSIRLSSLPHLTRQIFLLCLSLQGGVEGDADADADAENGDMRAAVWRAAVAKADAVGEPAAEALGYSSVVQLAGHLERDALALAAPKE